ncbi:probable protein arginine N-methyltransferase 6 [Chenopodium quinoa]|uniref:probable protein arginine N-methyltransferase 6 n=1 Tax=Chenopodium quinoa TaxID=63459 RepID=UPI000B76DF12|nr:probable protein arginine N-methyltransferase 6 [Chenopodium quinoa]
MLATSSGGDCNGHSTSMAAPTSATTTTTAAPATYHRDWVRKARRLSRDASSADGAAISDAPPCTDFDVAYFQSYSHLGIHEEMIKDHVRTSTYQNAILKHQHLIAGKVVVDVGCGTGILSIFCAQAGAKRVYAVDASDIAVQANEVVNANNLSDIVKVLHGRVEDVEIDEEVDIIISEWMGYMLLYESMLGSVITARDRWLKPGGLILPSHATLYMAPVTNPDRYSQSIDFWRNVYGIDMSAMVPLAKQCAFEEPSVETISGENVLTWPHVVKHVDCYTTTLTELETVEAKFKLQSMMRAPLHGFAFWFDVEFGGPANLPTNNGASSNDNTTNNNCENDRHRKRSTNPSEALVLSTAPEGPPTHWQQTLIYFYEPIEVEQDQLIEGSVTLTQSKENRRFMNIHLEYTSGGRKLVKESVMR